MPVATLLADHEDVDVPSETILNVMRESDDLVLGTSSIAESIGMSTDGARYRLRQLESQGRVLCQEIGSGEQKTLVWGLDPEERQEPLNPDIARLVRLFDNVRSKARYVLLVSLATILISFSLIFAGVSGVILGTSVGFLPNDELILNGWKFAAAGGIVTFFAGMGLYGTVVFERAAEWAVNRGGS